MSFVVPTGLDLTSVVVSFVIDFNTLIIDTTRCPPVNWVVIHSTDGNQVHTFIISDLSGVSPNTNSSDRSKCGFKINQFCAARLLKFRIRGAHRWI